MLIRSVRMHGKGKWKKILEENAPSFLNRSQVSICSGRSQSNGRIPVLTRNAGYEPRELNLSLWSIAIAHHTVSKMHDRGKMVARHKGIALGLRQGGKQLVDLKRQWVDSIRMCALASVTRPNSTIGSSGLHTDSQRQCAKHCQQGSLHPCGLPGHVGCLDTGRAG